MAMAAVGLMSRLTSPSASRSSLVHCSAMTGPPASAGFIAGSGATRIGIDVTLNSGLRVCGRCSLMRQCCRLRALVGHHRQVSRRSECAPPARTAIAHPLRWQPVQGARTVERKRVRGRVRAIPMRQPFELAGHAHQGVCRARRRSRRRGCPAPGARVMTLSIASGLDRSGTWRAMALTRGASMPSASPTARTAWRAPMLT